MRSCQDGRSDDRETDSRKGIDFPRRALEGAGDDPAILANAGYTLAYFGEDIGSMTALVDHALPLNPSFARGRHISGAVRLWVGRPDVTREHTEDAPRLR